MAKGKRNEDDDQPVEARTSHGVARVTNVLALLLVKDVKQQAEAIQLLDRAGFEPREIAALLGTTPNTVSVALYQAKQLAKRSRGKTNRRKR